MQIMNIPTVKDTIKPVKYIKLFEHNGVKLALIHKYLGDEDMYQDSNMFQVLHYPTGKILIKYTGQMVSFFDMRDAIANAQAIIDSWDGDIVKALSTEPIIN